MHVYYQLITFMYCCSLRLAFSLVNKYWKNLTRIERLQIKSIVMSMMNSMSIFEQVLNYRICFFLSFRLIQFFQLMNKMECCVCVCIK